MAHWENTAEKKWIRLSDTLLDDATGLGPWRTQWKYAHWANCWSMITNHLLASNRKTTHARYASDPLWTLRREMFLNIRNSRGRNRWNEMPPNPVVMVLRLLVVVAEADVDGIAAGTCTEEENGLMPK